MKTAKEIFYSEAYYNLGMCIADFFEHGHSLEEIMNMDYNTEYLFILNSINNRRNKEDGKGEERELRPIQTNAIKKAKELKKSD